MQLSNVMRKNRRRTAALRDARAGFQSCTKAKRLDCASPLALWNANKKGRLPKKTPLMILDPIYYGVRNRKNRAGSVALTGIPLENAPVPSNVPTEFVVHVDTGAATFVDVTIE